METAFLQLRGARASTTMNKRERRRVQRIRFKLPIAGSVQGGTLSIVDLSVTGAKAQHDFPLPSGRNMKVDFFLRGERISLTCSVVRCRLERSGSKAAYSSGLKFSDDAELASSPLRRLITEIVGRDLEERRKQRRAVADDSGILV